MSVRYKFRRAHGQPETAHGQKTAQGHTQPGANTARGEADQPTINRLVEASVSVRPDSDEREIRVTFAVYTDYLFSMTNTAGKGARPPFSRHFSHTHCRGIGNAQEDAHGATDDRWG